jgi:propane monooxygenase large subunit
MLADAPPFCWTCQMASVIDEDQCHRVVGDRTRFYCSKECQWLDESNPGRYTGDRNWFDRYHGWKLQDVIRDLDFLREDGRTLIGQPHLRSEGRWTIDDIAAIDLTIESPNINTAKARGLPSGNWHEPFAAAQSNGGAGRATNGHKSGG